MKKRSYGGCMAVLEMTPQVSVQVRLTSGGFITGGERFGADGNSSIPLRICHDANQPIEFYTSNLLRMRFCPDQKTPSAASRM